ncbi:hypothetical protein [Prevotella sp. 10(H)]|uniref:hypothetical protein n=1 Tax=Prevotella sp. 10(H) TaxID=1158294 RepID=UPI0004A784A3|nr:hypothetical protein [Prevotella sp. 10(H)]
MKFKIYIKPAFIILFILCSIHSFSQVTIGNDEAPVKGALLDIKNIVPTVGNTDPSKIETSQTGGMVLPRVNLEALNTLSPFVTTPNDPDVKKIHTGLVVYNVKVNSSASLVQGIYCWDGNKWNLLIAGKVANSPWYKVGTTSPSLYNTDNSYLTAKVVVGGTTVDKINGGDDAALTVKGGDASINEITIGHGKAKIVYNTAVGKDALSKNTTGSNNMATGLSALLENTIGSNNIALGASALSTSSTTSGNIAIGADAGSLLTIGNNNILLGEGIQKSGVEATKINIANTISGLPGATVEDGRMGIGTNDPKATLHIAGDMKYTNAPPISGGSVMMIDDNGYIGKTLLAPRLFTSIEVVSSKPQDIGTAINNGNPIPVKWDDVDFTRKDIAELGSGSDNEIVFTKTGVGSMYEISGYVSYNTKTSAPSTYPTNISTAQSTWLAVVNVMIQKYNGSTWETLTAAQATWTGSAMGLPKMINIPPTPVFLKQNDKIRMVIQKPSQGVNHGGALIETLIAGSGFTKGFKLINL